MAVLSNGASLKNRTFIITELLSAAGGFGEVYRARQPALQRDVAIKVLKPELAAQPSVLVLFEREARAAARLLHPNVLPVIDFGFDEAAGVHFLAMPYVHGARTLQALRGQPIDQTQILGLLAAVAGALDAAHAAGIVHRDVKPANVLLDQDDRPLLADFGIAHLAGPTSATATGRGMGTAVYMAPERWRGEPGDGRSDQYALAVMAYELLAGRPPFVGELHSLLNAHLNEAAPPLASLNPSVTPAMEAAIARGLAKRPEDRFTTCRELTTALREGADAREPDQSIARGERGAALRARSDAAVGEAMRRLAEDDPEGALALLHVVQKADPAYPGLDRRLAEAQAALDRQGAERQRVARLDDAYRKAVASLEAGRPVEALSLLEQLSQEAPSYADVAALVQRARREVERVAEEERLAEVLAMAETQLRGGRPADAVTTVRRLTPEQRNDPRIRALLGQTLDAAQQTEQSPATSNVRVMPLSDPAPQGPESTRRSSWSGRRLLVGAAAPAVLGIGLLVLMPTFQASTGSGAAPPQPPSVAGPPTRTPFEEACAASDSALTRADAALVDANLHMAREELAAIAACPGLDLATALASIDALDAGNEAAVAGDFATARGFLSTASPADSPALPGLGVAVFASRLGAGREALGTGAWELASDLCSSALDLYPADPDAASCVIAAQPPPTPEPTATSVPAPAPRPTNPAAPPRPVPPPAPVPAGPAPTATRLPPPPVVQPAPTATRLPPPR